MKPLNPPLVGVQWDDARGDATKVVSPLDGTLNAFHKPSRIITYGLLLRDDELGVTVVAEDMEDNDFRGPTFILRSLVRKMWVVSKNPKRGQKVRISHEETAPAVCDPGPGGAGSGLQD